MRLADFILAHVEPILVEWEAFARSIWPGGGATPDPKELRDDAEGILRTTAADMASAQSPEEQEEKSRGNGHGGQESNRVNQAARSHGRGRVVSGLSLEQVVAEYRALRASVLRLWRESKPSAHLEDLDDITRFNESIDQSLTQSLRAYEQQVERVRKALLARQRASHNEAERANRAKDTFLAMLSHELRTPLNAIVGWMSILRDRSCNELELAEGLEVIDRNTRAQVQLIDDVLDVSRIVSGKLRMDIGPCELIEVINAGVDAVRPAAQAREIAIDLELDPAASHASCDAARIQQVVWNLLSNAVKFTPKGGRISVTLARVQSSLQIQVSDNGEGISPEVLPYVFDRFRQADSSPSRRIGGLGLGLSIVKYLVEAHGGTVQAHSAGEGHGATFTVRLPVRAVSGGVAAPSGQAQKADKHTAQRRETPAHATESLDGVRVLVVDDEADARRLLAKVLVRVGAIVSSASSAAEAMKVLAKFHPDVLVSDLGMPEEDGLELIRQVRSLGHHATDLPAIALTAFARKDDEREALQAGYQVHIPKPVDPHKLLSVIARLTGRGG